MGIEIERKFLLASEAWRADADEGVKMKQGYFSGVAGATVRVRIAGEQAFLTIKGRPSGLIRSEFEYPVPVGDAEAMLREFCGTRIIDKCRYHVPYNGFVWEVDEYFGENAGLFTAELELDSAGTEFPVPPWLGEEVTGDSRYTNGSLSRMPFARWEV